MSVTPQTIIDLLNNRQWSTCADLAAQALAEGEREKPEKAFLAFARSKSLSNLDKYTLALEPGQYAVYLAEEIRDYDLLGKALIEVAWIQHKIPGMESLAISTQRRYFDLYPRFKDKTLRENWLSAQVNLGVYCRAAGQFAEALEQFRFAYQEAKKRGDTRTAHLSRSDAAWEALRLGQVAMAEALIREADSANGTQRQKASDLLDLAQLAFLKQNLPSACSFALEAATYCEKIPDLFARSMEVLHRIAERSGEAEAAIVTALIAKLKAEADDRQDMVEQIRASVRSLALRFPKAVESLMSTIDGVKR